MTAVSTTPRRSLRGLSIDESVDSSYSSAHSDCTVHHRQIRRFSNSSLLSIGSPPRRKRNTSPSARSISTLSLTVLRANLHSDHRSFSRSISTTRQSSFGSLLSSNVYSDSITEAEHRHSRLVGVTESEGESRISDHGTEDAAASETDAEIGLSLRPEQDANVVDDLPDSPEPSTFKRWVSTLRRKKHVNPSILKSPPQRWTMDDFELRSTSPPKCRTHHHKTHSYASSTAFVTAVKSATVTIASASIATISRRNSHFRRTQQQSILSGSDPRPSGETQRSIVDEGARQRSRKRREKLEELVRTEESYVADLKALSNA